MRAIAAIAPFGIDCAEQPVRADDWLGMARVQRAVDVPLMAHEGCFSLTRLHGAARARRRPRAGRQHRAARRHHPGAARDRLRRAPRHRDVLHNQPLGIASAAQVHLGAARASVLGHAMELFGHVMLEDDLILEPLDYSGGRVRVPEGPGLGVTLDEAALDRYATGPAVVLER